MTTKCAQTKQPEFLGILFDIFDETIIERSPIIRGNEDEAYSDAMMLAKQSGRDESYVYVLDRANNAVIYG